MSCILLNEASMLRASAVAKTVFPTPGTSSSRTCPLARRQTSIFSTASSCPRKTRVMLFRRAVSLSVMALIWFGKRLGIGLGEGSVWDLVG